MSLFNSLIKPVLLYGAEIWGNNVIGKNLESTITKIEKFAAERFYLSYAKYTLGVHKNATNDAVRGELGILPIGMEALSLAIKYREHIEEADVESLLGIYKSRANKEVDSWLVKLAQMTDTPVPSTFTQPTVQITFNNLKNLYIDRWRASLNKPDCKLRSYALVKDNICLEKYLMIIKNREHRRAVTQLRTSAHKLHIETGRYTVPKTLAVNRLCPLCKQGVEDEKHFLLNCHMYKLERAELFNTINNTHTDFSQLSDDDKFVFLLALEAEGEVIRSIGKFCYTAFEKRKNATTTQNN